MIDTVSSPADTTSRPSTGIRIAGLTGLVFAVLQSACTAVLALSGVRVAIGLAGLAAASTVYGPARGFHQDAIRIPMLFVGAASALLNMAILFRVWHLRSRASAGWRRRTLSPRERRSERLQLALSLLTLVLVGAETVTHHMMHRADIPQGQSRPR